MKTLKQSTLAAAITSALALGMSGQAAADVYASSSLEITNLSIAFKDANGTPAFPQANGGALRIDRFDFTMTNTASLNPPAGAAGFAGSTVTCGGGPTGGVTGPNNCGTGSALALDGDVINAPFGDQSRMNNDNATADGTLRVLGLGGGNWSNSDSVIYVSALTHPGNLTHTDQISESNLASNAKTNASASTLIQSITGFNFTFTVIQPGPMSLDLGFLADTDMWAQILNEPQGGSAQANVSLALTLQRNDGGAGLVTWSPNGTFGNVDVNGDGIPDDTNDCLAAGAGLSCVETDDGGSSSGANATGAQDLNTTIGTIVNNTTETHSQGPNISGDYLYGIKINGIGAGTWSLTLAANTSTQISRAPIPEPGMLALLGIGLAGLGFATRRRVL